MGTVTARVPDDAERILKEAGINMSELIRSAVLSQAQRIEAQKALDELQKAASKRSKAKTPSETLVREMRDAR
ncbi:MAG: hypothetical protein AABY18_02765 [Candidatus Thermoplasmatota archaeon]